MILRIYKTNEAIKARGAGLGSRVEKIKTFYKKSEHQHHRFYDIVRYKPTLVNGKRSPTNTSQPYRNYYNSCMIFTLPIYLSQEKTLVCNEQLCVRTSPDMLSITTNTNNTGAASAFRHALCS